MPVLWKSNTSHISPQKAKQGDSFMCMHLVDHFREITWFEKKDWTDPCGT